MTLSYAEKFHIRSLLRTGLCTGPKDFVGEWRRYARQVLRSRPSDEWLRNYRANCRRAGQSAAAWVRTPNGWQHLVEVHHSNGAVEQYVNGVRSSERASSA